jgi:flagellar biosynthesis protein FlhB
MAETSSQERTERPTPKRIRDARRRGQVARSRELPAAAVVLGAALVLFVGGIPQDVAQLMQGALRFDGAALQSPEQMPARFAHLLGASLMVFVPLLAATLVAALVAPLVLGGWNFSVEALQPKLERIDPIAGFGRMFSLNSLVELLKSLLKFLLLAAIAWACWVAERDILLALGHMPVNRGMAEGLAICLRAFTWLSAGLLIIAAIDAPYQLWEYQKNLRMTRQEVREELKESEGRPEVKAKIRRVQQEMARRRMMDEVPKADVVITNPTHYAVALRYNAGKMRAPRVVAKGADVLALAIRELARQHRIPLVEAPPLARALYRSTELEMEIPVNLYAAVAQVLTYIYQLRQWRSGPQPVPPEIGEVPGGEPGGGPP